MRLRDYACSFGPQRALRANQAYAPFVDAPIGQDQASVSFSVQPLPATGMALLTGGGVDINFKRSMAFRAAADWMMFDSHGSTGSKNFPVPIPVVFKFRFEREN